jgi:hypothetical protein
MDESGRAPTRPQQLLALQLALQANPAQGRVVAALCVHE